MNRKSLLTILITFVMLGVVVMPVWASNGTGPDLARVRNATARFHNLRAAMAAGYNLVPGLDFCFDNPPVGGMGFHYINTALLDTNVDPLMPEAMVYAPGPNGKFQLGAVEYIVPAAAWDAANSQPPTLFGRTFELNQALGVYALHAWIWSHNSLGMFNDWNPKVSCP
jgi:hypothetical protein